LFWKHRRRYGARRIAADLADLGEACSPRVVGRIMKNQSLRAIQPKSFVPKTTDSRHRPRQSQAHDERQKEEVVSPFPK
jgi:putative transposase